MVSSIVAIGFAEVIVALIAATAGGIITAVVGAKKMRADIKRSHTQDEVDLRRVAVEEVNQATESLVASLNASKDRAEWQREHILGLEEDVRKLKEANRKTRDDLKVCQEECRRLRLQVEGNK